MSTLKVNKIEPSSLSAIQIGTDANTVVTVTGDLHVDGDTVYNNVTNVTVQDPIMDIGGGVDGAAPGSDDNKDRGIVFQYHNGSAAKKGFFGWDDSAGKFTFIADATVSSEVVSGDAGDVAFGSLSISGFDCDGAAVFNESGNNVDFRVESDGNANMLFVDGGENRVGIGVADPDSTLEVLSTTTQQKWSYDADSFATMTVADASHTTLATAETGNLILDAAGNIELNADAGTISFKDDSASYGSVSSSGWQFDANVTVGVNDTGYDVKFFGATAGAFMEWDESADELEIRGGAASPGKLLLSTAETTVVNGDKLGQIDFQAPLESSGTDAILVGASIWAEADDTFAANLNDTDLVFATGKSEAATEKMRLDSDGRLGIGTTDPGAYNDSADNFVIYKAGNTGLTIATGVNDWGSIYFADSTSDNHQGAISYHHQTDKLYLGTAGTDTQITVDNSGKLGIGIATPNEKLTVEGVMSLKEQASSPSDSSGYGKLFVKSADSKLYFRNDSGTETDLTAGGGGMTSFILEDADGTEVSISDAEEVKFIGSGVTINWTDTSDGSDADPFDLTFTVDAAQTGITSLLATDIKIGEDDETKIDFETADRINFYANNALKASLFGSVFTPGANDGTSLGSAALGWGDLYLADGGALYLGDDQDVTLTHVADTGLLLNGAMQIQFRDSDIHISSDADGDMQLRADTNVVTNIAGTDRLTVSAAGLNVNGAIVSNDVRPTTANTYALGSATKEWSDLYLGDASVIYFGNDQDVTLTHVPDVGLTLTNTIADTDNRPVILNLKSEEDDLVADDVIGTINFTAGDSSGTDAAAIAASIEAVAEDTFTSSVNKTSLIFKTGESEAAPEKMRLWSDGQLELDTCALVKGSHAGAILGGNVSAGIVDYHLNTMRLISKGGDAATQGKFQIICQADDANPTTTVLDVDASGHATFGKRLLVDDTTNATSTTDGSLQTDGGLSVALDAVIGDDLYMLSDSATIHFGADSDVTLTHEADQGLNIISAVSGQPTLRLGHTGNDTEGGLLRFYNVPGDSSSANGDILGKIDWRFEDTGNGSHTAARILSKSRVVTAGSEEGSLIFQVSDGGSDNTTIMDLNSTLDGGVHVVTDLQVGDDLLLNSDSSVISMGAGADATFTHDGTTGLTIAATPISIDSTGELHLNSTTGDIKLQDGGADQIVFDLDGTANEVIMKPAVDGDDLVFSQYDGNECARVLDGESSVPSNAAGVAYGLGFKIPVYSINSTGGARAVTLTHKQGGSIIQCNASNNSGGDITITLPAIDAVGKQGVQYTVTLTSQNASNRLVKILTNGADGNDKFVGFGFNGSTSYADTDGGDTVTIGNDAILGTTVRVTNLSSGAGNAAEVWLVEAFGTAAVTID